MSLSLHQIRCFVMTMECGSFTKASQELGLSQPSLSEQIRLLERHLGAQLFRRLGRGVAPTEAAKTFSPYAHSVLEAVTAGDHAVSSLNKAETGTVRFGLFGAAHLYLSGELVCRTLQKLPGVRIALVGQNSSEVIEDIRAGNLEAGLVALPIHNEDRLRIEPVARDELVYVSSDPQRAKKPATPAVIAAARLVLSEVTWGDKDFTRQQLKRTVQAANLSLQPHAEVENVETAIEIAAQGYADTIAARGVVRRVAPKMDNKLFAVELEPRLYEEFAIVYRTNTHLSLATRTVIKYARDLLLEATTPKDAS